jgi:hypothetical protein
MSRQWDEKKKNVHTTSNGVLKPVQGWPHKNPVGKTFRKATMILPHQYQSINLGPCNARFLCLVLVFFRSIADPLNKETPPLASLAGIDNFVYCIFFDPFVCDDRSWLRVFV